MLEMDYEALSALGLTPALAGRALELEAKAGAERHRLVRVTEVHRETLVVRDGRQENKARVLPRLVRALADEGTALAVGDWGLAGADVAGDLWIAHRVPPASHIARRDSEGLAHPIVSNVDVALLVMGLDADWNPRRLERFLALVDDASIVPVVVLTKRDVVERNGEAWQERVHALRDRVPAAIAIHAVDATHPSAAEALAPHCGRGSTLVLLGSSGAGKSTLTNTLAGMHLQDTGEVRADDSRGRHTTTSRSLHLLPGGACIIDTPGLRTLRPDSDAAVVASFEDIASLAARCRFVDCGHDSEPGCAVRDAIDADRLRNWRKLLREVRRDTQTALERRREVAGFKVRGRAVKQKMRMKRGELS